MRPLAALGCAGLVLALAVGAPLAQFRQRVDLITIDAGVVDGRGEPVLDLRASDFVVLVDGKPRKIVAFRRGAAGNAPSSPSGESPEDAAGVADRVVVLVVQRDHIRPHEGRSFFEAGASFIDTLPASDQVAVWTMPSDSPELRLLRDREALKQTLRSIRGTAPPPHPLINLTPEEAVAIAYFRDPMTLGEATKRECSRHIDPGPVCREEVDIEARRLYEEVKLRAADTLRQLDHLIRMLSAFSGPKHVILITTGPAQTPENAAILQRVAGAAARARVHIHAVQLAHALDMGRADGRGRPAPRVSQSSSSSYSLAAMTGGMAVTPSDPRPIFRRLGAELAGAYELGIEADASDRDGKPHRIEVRVPARQGLSIRAREQFVLHSLSEPAMPSPAPAEPVPAAAEMTPLETGDPVPEAVLARVGEYIARFEREFSSAVAEERYVQLIRPLRGSPSWPSDERALEWHDGDWTDHPRTGPLVDRRQLLSDVLLVHTPQGWVGYRDVAEVNGRAVRARQERVSRLFLSREANRHDQLRRIAAESARYNIGGFTRTLNIPTLPLFFLRSQNHGRFTWTAAGTERLDAVTTRVIRYEEHQRPTLIGSRAGEDVPMSGRLWIDEASGAVVQSEIRVLAGERRNERRGTLVTRYRQDPRFPVLIPDYMWEWYDSGVANVAGSVMTYTIVEGLARYTNYRKFDVETGQDIR